MDDNQKLLSCFGLIIGVVAALVFSSIFGGIVLSMLWGWFIVPTFSVPSISIPVAIGIDAMVSFLTYHGSSYDKPTNTEERVTQFLSIIFFRPLFYLGLGWLVTLFM